VELKRSNFFGQGFFLLLAYGARRALQLDPPLCSESFWKDGIRYARTLQPNRHVFGECVQVFRSLQTGYTVGKCFLFWQQNILGYAGKHTGHIGRGSGHCELSFTQILVDATVPDNLMRRQIPRR
jgi:hypothetical protein